MTKTIECRHCGETLRLAGRDTECDCGALYNGFGQLLRSQALRNPSMHDDEINDLEGDSIMYARDE